MNEPTMRHVEWTVGEDNRADLVQGLLVVISLYENYISSKEIFRSALNYVIQILDEEAD